MTGTRYARSGALRIAYELRGAMHRRPWLVLIQGMGFDRSGWEPVLRKLALVWGVIPVRMTSTPAGGHRIPTAVRDAHTAGTVAAGELVVVLAGHPIEGGPRFPTVRIVRVGEGGRCEEP